MISPSISTIKLTTWPFSLSGNTLTTDSVADRCLLEHYRDQPLINHYDVYQHLMDYWAEVIQDDVYQITAPVDQGGGWKAETYRILVKDKKGKEKDKGWTCDLVPKALIAARYFADQQAEIDQLQAELEAVSAQQTELEEEHGGEEGVFGDLDRINKASVNAKVGELKLERAELNAAKGNHSEELSTLDSQLSTLQQWLKLSAKDAKLKKQIKDADAALDADAYAKYPTLTEAEVQTLVVDDKWLARLDADIHGEMDRISQSLTQRVKELAERYETPLPQLSDRVTKLEEKVNGHLERMGFGVTESKLVEVGS